MKSVFVPFTDKFRPDWQLFLEHWEAYTRVCLIAIGIAVYLRFRAKKNGGQE